MDSNRDIFHWRTEKHILFIKVGSGLTASGTEVLESRDAQTAEIQGRFDKTKGRMSLSAGHMGASRKTIVIATNTIL